MDHGVDIPFLLARRKLTRAIATALRAQVVDHLTALTPVLRPEITFGKFIQGNQKDWIVKSDQALKELRTLYDTIAPASPYNLRVELTPPLDVGGLSLEVTPVEYTHVAQHGSNSRTITVRRPLVWTLSYGGFAPAAFRRLLDSRMRSSAEVQRFLLAYLALHVVIKMQPGVVNVLTALRFPVATVHEPEFGALPITRIGVGLTTERPPDAVIIESAEVTGMDAFEEVVKLEEISRLRDPMREQLLEMAKKHVPEFAAS